MRRVLVVDDNRENIELLSNFLIQDNHAVQVAYDVESALHRMRAWKPHLVLFDVDPAQSRTIAVVSKIRSLIDDQYTAILLISKTMTVEEVIAGLNAGADDYLTRPFQAQDFLSRVHAMLRLREIQDALKRANHRIEELSSGDDLTGLMNMKFLYRKGEEEILRSKKFRKPISSLLVNLDGFSHINQSYGFLSGNYVLQETGMRIKQCLRAVDFIARIGADEFFILLSETDLASAEGIAERVRQSIEATPFRNDRQLLKVTATIGVAGLTYDQSNQHMADLFHFTAEALRSAKSNGMNCIEVYSFT